MAQCNFLYVWYWNRNCDLEYLIFFSGMPMAKIAECHSSVPFYSMSHKVVVEHKESERTGCSLKFWPILDIRWS